MNDPTNAPSVDEAIDHLERLLGRGKYRRPDPLDDGKGIKLVAAQVDRLVEDVGEHDLLPPATLGQSFSDLVAVADELHEEVAR